LRLRLLQEALKRVSRPAQQEILFEVKMQAGQGDPSPAVTVARAKALKPEAVRQTCKRLIDRSTTWPRPTPTSPPWPTFTSCAVPAERFRRSAPPVMSAGW
jgi:hypothetical protein